MAVVMYKLATCDEIIAAGSRKSMRTVALKVISRSLLGVLGFVAFALGSAYCIVIANNTVFFLYISGLIGSVVYLFFVRQERQ